MEEARRYGIEMLKGSIFKELTGALERIGVAASLQSGIHASFKSLVLSIEGQASLSKTELSPSMVKKSVAKM